MAQIHVDYRVLKKPARNHNLALQKLENKSKSKYLLLFYATECALKYVVLDENKHTSTKAIKDNNYFGSDGHDLLKGLKAQRKITRRDIGMPPSPVRARKGKEKYELRQLHQIWRYGIPINREDEEKVVEWLSLLCKRLLEDYI